jgi:nucleotide sugar dehydrogenase
MKNLKKTLIRKIQSRSATVCVVGLGYAGLPMAGALADAGFNVVGADINRKRIALLSNGIIDIDEFGLGTLIQRVIGEKKLTLTYKVEGACSKADVILLSVQTPIDRDKKPDLSALSGACITVADGLSEGKLVVLESTVPVGTTVNYLAPLLEEKSSLDCGNDFWLAYCPERMTPGNSLIEIVKNDRIIGGYNDESSEIVERLMRAFIKGNILVTDATTAEVVKLAENTFRDVNIAFANELALICEDTGVSFSKVRELANTHPRVNILAAGPGVGGSCLPKDPYFLLHPQGRKKLQSKVVLASRFINDFMPLHVVNLTLKGLREVGKIPEKARVVILGAAYKANVSDSRLSPSRTIIRKLLSLGLDLKVYDPYCKESFGAEKTNNLSEALGKADCLVIVTDHSQFKNMDLSEIKNLMNANPIIVDGRRIINPLEAEKYGFRYHGVGVGKMR